jgi:hypothetical protein
MLIDLGAAIADIVHELKTTKDLYPFEIGIDKDFNIVILMSKDEPKAEMIKVEPH